MDNKDLTTIEQVLIKGDLSTLSTEQRLSYVKQLCEVTGLNILTNPFKFMSLQGRLVLYADKGCAEQLRKVHGVGIQSLTSQTINGVYVVTAKAVDKSGREDSATGAVTIDGLKGDSLANALMKAETKAKRRVTLSICGLGMLDESELETIPGTQVLQERRVVPPPAKPETLTKLEEPLYYEIPDEIKNANTEKFLERRNVKYDAQLGVYVSYYDLGPLLKQYKIDKKLLPEKSDSIDYDSMFEDTVEEETKTPVVVEETPLQKAQKRAKEMRK